MALRERNERTDRDLTYANALSCESNHLGLENSVPELTKKRLKNIVAKLGQGVKLYCLQCDKPFARRTVLSLKHFLYCNKCKNKISFQCTKCFTFFYDIQILSLHIESDCKTHPGYKCPYCHYTIGTETDLQKHTSSRHQVSMKETQITYLSICFTCQQKFKFSEMCVHRSQCEALTASDTASFSI